LERKAEFLPKDGLIASKYP
jgi:hypothetical protein